MHRILWTVFIIRQKQRFHIFVIVFSLFSLFYLIYNISTFGLDSMQVITHTNVLHFLLPKYHFCFFKNICLTVNTVRQRYAHPKTGKNHLML